MMELPEALVMAEQLNGTVAGRRIVSVKAGHSPHGFAFFWGDPNLYPQLLEGRTIETAEQLGGMVELRCGDTRLTLGDGVNLRYLEPGARVPDKHQLLLELEDGSALVCRVQMYGGMWAFPAGANENYYYLVAREKPSPLSDAFDETWFSDIWRQAKPTLSAKALLATEQRIPGLGNGCLQDILYRARIHPKRKLEQMGREEQDAIFRSVKEVLREMADQGGRDTEKDLFGQSGRYQTYLSAKTWKGVCPFCGGPITRQAYLGGNVYFCAHCQPV